MTVRFRPASLVQTHRVKVMNRNKVTLLTERQREVIALIDQVGRAMALREILAELGSQINKRGLREDLATLEARSLITSTGHGRGARWKRSAMEGNRSRRIVPGRSSTSGEPRVSAPQPVSPQCRSRYRPTPFAA